MSPEKILAIINCVTGSFSALSGIKKMAEDPASLGVVAVSNPAIYIVGGILTVGIGLGNWFGSRIGIWGTIVFIVSSLINGWFGAGGADFGNWRFWTLNAYAIVASILILLLFRSRLVSGGNESAATHRMTS